MADTKLKGVAKAPRAPSFASVLKVLAEQRRYECSGGSTYSPLDDEWLKNKTRVAILDGIIGKVGFDDDEDDPFSEGNRASGGIGYTEVDPDRWRRILRELSREPVMQDIKIRARVGTIRRLSEKASKPTCSWAAVWMEDRKGDAGIE
jgi:hypothetical protein